MTALEMIIEQLQHPFWMVMAGIILWHLIEWTATKTTRIWWMNSHKSMLAAFVFGLIVICWDDEWAGMIQDYHAEFTFEVHYYFFIGPAFELLKKGATWFKAFNPFKKR